MTAPKPSSPGLSGLSALSDAPKGRSPTKSTRISERPRAGQTVRGNVLTPSGWVRGEIAFGDHIQAVEGAPVDPSTNQDVYVLPGFIDLHVHGGGGRDVMEGGDAATAIAKMHARHGTTSMLATTMTAPSAEIEKVMTALGPMCRERTPGSARILGVHLEGPYINSGKLGAQPNCVRVAVVQELERYHAMAPVRVLVYFWNVGGGRRDKRDMARALVEFVKSHYTLATPVATFSKRADLPQGFGVVHIDSTGNTWTSGESGVTTVSEIYGQLASRISAKNKLLPRYRARLPHSGIWLLVYSGVAVSRGVEIPHGMGEWTFPFSFEKVLFFSQLSGAVVDIQRSNNLNS